MAVVSVADAQRWADGQRLQQLVEQFAVLVPANDLQPAHLGFEEVEPGQSTDPHFRPFYPVYIPRRATTYTGIATPNPTRLWVEADLIGELRAGRSVVLIGPPTDGKSRTLYAVVSRLHGHEVVIPRKQAVLPSDAAFARLQGCSVVVVLDNLNDYVGAKLDLQAFIFKLKAHADRVVVIATCRDKPELAAVEQAVGTSLRRVYEEIPLKLALLPPSPEQKRELAQMLGTPWRPESSDDFPTLGHITMSEPMLAMRLRFHQLDRVRRVDRELRDTLQALKLLAAAGVLPLTHGRLRAILEHLFTHRDLDLGACLDALAEQAFLHRPGHQNPVRPEPAYLRDVVAYRDGGRPEDDFPTLAKMLADIGDADGLVSLSYYYTLIQEDDIAALACLEAALRIDPSEPVVWANRGALLGRLGRLEEALVVLERAIALEEAQPDAWHNKGAVLARLRRPEDALAASERALVLRNDYPEAWLNKGAVLFDLRRPEDALAAFERVLALRPDDRAAWYNKGIALGMLNRPAEALAAFDRAMSLGKEDAEVWYNKGTALANLDRPEEALVAYEQALALRGDDPETWYNKGLALTKLNRLEEALGASERALALRQEYREAWHVKGAVLMQLNRLEESLAAFQQVLALGSDQPAIWSNLGIVLGRLGRYEEALAAFDRALALRPDDPGIRHNKGQLLRLIRQGANNSYGD